MQKHGLGKLLLLTLLLGCFKSALADLFTFTNIDVPGATSTYPIGINNLGQVVGVYNNANGAMGGFLDSGGVFTTLSFPFVGPNYAVNGLNMGINDQGQIVTNLPNCGLYSEGVCATIVDPQNPTASVEPPGINDSGQIVGTEGTPEGSYGFLDRGGKFSLFNFSDGSPYVTNDFFGISDNGRIVGYYLLVQGNSFGYPDFVISPPYPLSLDCYLPSSSGSPDCLQGTPYGINDAGLIVGARFTGLNLTFTGYVNAGGDYIPLIDPNGASNLSTIPRGINNSDEIVGYYGDANGAYHGFLASPTAALVPEPRTIPLLFVCLTAFAVVLRRNSKPVGQE